MSIQNAAIAAGFGFKPAQAKLTKFSAVEPRHGATIAFMSVELASGMTLHGLRLMDGKNGFWVALPSQRQTAPDGTPKIGPDGKAL